MRESGARVDGAGRRLSAAARHRGLRVAVSLVATAALLAFVVRHVGLARLGAALRAADPTWLAAALALNLGIHVFVPAEKWRRLLGRLGHSLTFGESARIWLGCQPLRFTLPMKSGELFKVVYLQAVHRVPPAVGTWALVFDKLSNVVALIAFGAAGLVWAPLGARVSVVIGLLLLPSPLLFAGALPEVLRERLARAPGRVGRFARELIDAMVALPTGVRLRFFAVSLTQVVAEAISFGVCLRALGVHAPALDVLFRTPLVILLANLPVTLSGIGTRELGMLWLFAPHGSPEQLAATGLVLSFVGPVLLVIAGLPFVGGFFAGAFGGAARAGETPAGTSEASRGCS